jgi:hypothetical protein
VYIYIQDSEHQDIYSALKALMIIPCRIVKTEKLPDSSKRKDMQIV